MNTARLLPVLLAAAAGMGGGYFLGHRASEPSAAPPPNIPVAAKPAPPPVQAPVAMPAGTVPAGIAKLIGDAPVTAANVTEITKRVLEESDPVTRLAACLFLIESMTPETAEGIRQAFFEVTKTSGRRHDGEWSVLMRRYGAVLGEQGLKNLMKDKFSAGLALEGFAGRDPDAALAALTSLGGMDKSFAGDTYLTNAWLSGLCRHDFKRGLDIALSGKYQNADGKIMLTQVINTLGVDGARDALQAAIEQHDDQSETYVFKTMVNALGDTLFHKFRTLGKPEEMLTWLEGQKDVTYVDQKLFSDAIYDNLVTGNPAETIAFLERTNTGRDDHRGTARLHAALQAADPEVLAGMDERTFELLGKYLHPDPAAFQALAARVQPLNPARAEQLREAALPRVHPPPGFQGNGQ